MKNKEFDAHMRSFEHYHGHTILPSTYTVLRIDGRSFSKYTKKYKKPFDDYLHTLMCESAAETMDDLDGIVAYVESDEVSILLSTASLPFNGSIEKLVSVSASVMSSNFTALSGDVVSFDSRVISLPNQETVLDYFNWRHADAVKNSLNTYAYWLLRSQGLSEFAAHQDLMKKGVDYKNELLFNHGVNFCDTPEWTRRGSLIFRVSYMKQGFNPITKQTVMAKRRRVEIYNTIPTGVAYTSLIAEIISSNMTETRMNQLREMEYVK